MRCYWCDGDKFLGLAESGELLELSEFDLRGLKLLDYVCSWCSHRVSEPNPRLGDPKETVESVKEERDELRVQLEACIGEAAEARIDRVTDNSIASNA